MNESHANEERYHASGHDQVFGEERVCPDLSAEDAKEDEHGGEAGAPPAEQ